MVDQHPRRANVLVSHSQPLLSAGLVALLSRESCLDVFVAGADLLDAIEPRVDLVVADHNRALQLLQTPSEPTRAALSSSKILIVGYKPESDQIPDSFHERFHGYTLPGCKIDHLMAKVRTLIRQPDSLPPGEAQHDEVALALPSQQR